MNVSFDCCGQQQLSFMHIDIADHCLQHILSLLPLL